MTMSPDFKVVPVLILEGTHCCRSRVGEILVGPAIGPIYGATAGKISQLAGPIEYPSSLIRRKGADHTDERFFLRAEHHTFDFSAQIGPKRGLGLRGG